MRRKSYKTENVDKWEQKKTVISLPQWANDSIVRGPTFDDQQQSAWAVRNENRWEQMRTENGNLRGIVKKNPDFIPNEKEVNNP